MYSIGIITGLKLRYFRKYDYRTDKSLPIYGDKEFRIDVRIIYYYIIL
jgi:hypothetical protein